MTPRIRTSHPPIPHPSPHPRGGSGGPSDTAVVGPDPRPVPGTHRIAAGGGPPEYGHGRRTGISTVVRETDSLTHRGCPVQDLATSRSFGTSLVLYAEHGFNASAFTARVVNAPIRPLASYDGPDQRVVPDAA
ncbi:citrate/2-methylcitrate synthase [Streptomyces sp. WAC08241]|uniref:citrate/2-methylcitrate synthase n=1 Tax=Streptomyces sp. WAC08241 TaxID=2487421 RepID=UPI000F7A777D|nr:citrate/2-methylcitrate synthase [Streptomyces sp. WAC08241]RSS38142.1 hypothetical protein EF906_21570 [Streptomyces sp. WAC08241]